MSRKKILIIILILIFILIVSCIGVFYKDISSIIRGETWYIIGRITSTNNSYLILKPENQEEQFNIKITPNTVYSSPKFNIPSQELFFADQTFLNPINKEDIKAGDTISITATKNIFKGNEFIAVQIFKNNPSEGQ